MTPPTASDCAERLIDGNRLVDTALDLIFGDWRIRIRSNDQTLLERLAGYFGPYVTALGEVDAEVIAVECPPPELGLTFIDWRREAGKTGRKDSYLDLSNGRLVRKVRTGMVFLQHTCWRIAAGPCLANDNQLINFINSQYMNHLQQRGWLLCHAAALERDGRALGLAGFSGGGKSTLMLNLMEQPEWRYLTNDRLLIRQRGGSVECRGIPKMPRVNPGTLLHNPRLTNLLDEERAASLRSLPRDRLWSLEEKHDVMIAKHYGPDRLAQEARLAHLVILNWSHSGGHPARLVPVDVMQRGDLLDAVMKSPGPFYQAADGRFQGDTMPLHAEAYRRALQAVTVHEVTGRIDFETLAGELTGLVSKNPTAEGPHVS